MSAPEPFFQLWNFGQQHSRAYSFQPLLDLADVLSRAIGNEHMDMIAEYITRDHFHLVLQSNLSQNVPGSNRYRCAEHPLAVLGNPDQVNFKSVFVWAPSL
jgi:hypothetical protein